MYINYGDFNFFEYGVLVDSEHSDTDFSIIYCRPYDDAEDLFLFAVCDVDINDSWIDKDAVMSYSGMTPETFDPIRYAIDCIEYYGVENFSSPYNGYQFTENEIKEMLKYYLIASDGLNITW